MARARNNRLPPSSSHLIRLGARKKLLAVALSFPAAALRCFNAFLGPALDAQKVVLLEPFGLGDIISLQPLVKILLERRHEVVLCANPAWRPLYPDRPGFVWVDSKLAWGAHDAKSKYDSSAYLGPAFRDFLRTFRRAARGGVGLDTRGDIRDIITLYLAGCSRVGSLSRYLGSDTPVPSIAARTAPPAPELRRWEQNLLLLDLVARGWKPANPAPPAFPHLRGERAGSRQLGLIAVAPWKGRLWAPERWREIIGEFRARGFHLRSLCGPGQESLARQQTGDLETLELRSIPDWAAALSACRLLVTLDTGPMHLAAALGVPLVALFGSGLLPLWAPSGPQAVVIAHQDGPDPVVCHQVEENVPLGRIAMDRISAGEVADAARRLCEGT
jgi:hypothetical protein